MNLPREDIDALNIEQIKEEMESLRRQEERYRGILEAIEEGYYECDLNGDITFCNDAVERLIGYTTEEFIGLNYRVLYKEPDKVYRIFNKVFQTGEPIKSFALEMIHKDGSTVYGDLSVTPVKDREGRVTGFRGVGRDVTERKVFEEKLRYLSLHDQLTGLYNRAYFEEELQRLQGGRDYPVTLVSMDLDGLKIINDSLGHKQGDQLLKDCALVIKKPLRNSDCLARVGGDEFVAVLPGTDEAGGEGIVKRIQESLKEYNAGNIQIPLFISLGHATCKGPEEPLEETFKKADDRMYQNKFSKVSSVQREFVNVLLDIVEKEPEKGQRIARAFKGLVGGEGNERE